jgi:Rieske Fe-S protein
MNASMNMQAKLSRKSFFKIIAGLTIGSFLWFWYRLSEHQTGESDLSEFTHPADIPPGVNHFGKYYLFREGDTVVAFSTVCTHAGCRLGKTHSSVLQCACHGSQFEAATGKPLRGPAIKPLRKLDCQFNATTNQWKVKSAIA